MSKFAKTADVIGNTFNRHKIKRESGWTWRCARPGDSHYAYRVSWCPWNLVVTGDIGAIVITHYSFDDPWSAAAWINGAGFDYFMEKSNISKEYCAEATAELIVEMAYRDLRDGGRRAHKMFERIVDEFDPYGGDASEPSARKRACREMLSGSITADQAYEITGDGECCLMRYPDREHWKYQALKLWAAWMWETEPAWHRVVRVKRRLMGELRQLKRSPPIFAPILYAQRHADGRFIYFNGAIYWRWVRNEHGAHYSSVYPFKMFGRSWERFGLWRDGGGRWSDQIEDDISGWNHGRRPFVDVRPGERRSAA